MPLEGLTLRLGNSLSVVPCIVRGHYCKTGEGGRSHWNLRTSCVFPQANVYHIHVYVYILFIFFLVGKKKLLFFL